MKDRRPGCQREEDLSRHLDGDLDSARRVETGAHLDHCPECREVFADLSNIKAGLAGFRLARPERDLWPEIEQKLDSRARDKIFFPGWFKWLVPASVAAAVVVGLFLLNPQTKQVKQAPKSTPELIRTVDTVARAELAYRDAINSLNKVLESEKASFDPKTLEIVEQSLAQVETAIDHCRAALRKDPGNIDANRAMLAAYQQKVDLLFELVGRNPTARSVK